MDVELEDEDSVTERFHSVRREGDVNVAVVRLPHISNFTDFQALNLMEGVSCRYAEHAGELAGADMIILPGTKNTIEDLLELRRRGMDAAIVRHARAGGLVMGVCGGYQMLGTVLRDPMHVESRVPEVSGLGLLDMEVTFTEEKRTRQATGCVEDADDWLQSLNGALVDGYEIHAGQNRFGARCVPWMRIGGEVDGVRNAEGNVLGSYLHGLFDDGQLFGRIAVHIREQKGIQGAAEAPMTMEAFREREFDRVAAIVRDSLDMEAIYAIIRGER